MQESEAFKATRFHKIGSKYLKITLKAEMGWMFSAVNRLYITKLLVWKFLLLVKFSMFAKNEMILLFREELIYRNLFSLMGAYFSFNFQGSDLNQTTFGDASIWTHETHIRGILFRKAQYLEKKLSKSWKKSLTDPQFIHVFCFYSPLCVIFYIGSAILRSFDLVKWWYYLKNYVPGDDIFFYW